MKTISIKTYLYCPYRGEYTRDKHMSICNYPSGSPWCKHHNGDLVDGFPFDCKLKGVGGHGQT